MNDIVCEEIYNVVDITEAYENKKNIKQALEQSGIILFRNMNSEEIALEISKSLGNIYRCIDSDSHGITTISNLNHGRNMKNSLAFTQAGLYPHTDRSPIHTPPKYLINWSISPSQIGGELLICDGKAVYDYLKSSHLNSCIALSEPDAAIFSDTIDSYSGPIFTTNDDKFQNIRFRRDNCIKFKNNYHQHVHTLFEAIDLHTIKLSTNSGDGYIIDNTRWLHGRNPYKNDRIIKRIQIY